MGVGKNVGGLLDGVNDGFSVSELDIDVDVDGLLVGSGMDFVGVNDGFSVTIEISGNEDGAALVSSIGVSDGFVELDTDVGEYVGVLRYGAFVGDTDGRTDGRCVVDPVELDVEVGAYVGDAGNAALVGGTDRVIAGRFVGGTDRREMAVGDDDGEGTRDNGDAEGVIAGGKASAPGAGVADSSPRTKYTSSRNTAATLPSCSSAMALADREFGL